MLEETPEILIGDSWLSYEVGAFVRIPRNVMHDFRNRTDHTTRLLNVFISGGFERNMRKIVEWFAQN